MYRVLLKSTLDDRTGRSSELAFSRGEPGDGSYKHDDADCGRGVVPVAKLVPTRLNHKVSVLTCFRYQQDSSSGS